MPDRTDSRASSRIARQSFEGLVGPLFGLLLGGLLLGGLLLGGLLLAASIGEAAPFAPGQLLVGQSTLNSTGKVLQYQPTGAIVDTLDTTTAGANGSGEQTGMCLDAAGNLYTTNFFASSLSKFAPNGALVSATFIGVGPGSPNSCVFDPAGFLYVGLADADIGKGFGGGGLLKYDVSGTPALVAMYSPATEFRGTDWITLAADGCTMLYTSEGSAIKRFDVCANPQAPPLLSGAQLPDYCNPCDNGAGGAALSFRDLRILPGDTAILAADFGFGSGEIRRYAGSVAGGTGSQDMAYAGVDALDSFFPFGLTLDPGLTDFWTTDEVTGEIFKFAITGGGTPSQVFCGNGSSQPDCSPDANSPDGWIGLGGLAIVGPFARVPGGKTIHLLAAGYIIAIYVARRNSRKPRLQS